MTNAITGIAASAGIAAAPAFLFLEPDLSFEHRQITDQQAEIDRFEDAVAVARTEVQALADQAQVKMGQEAADVFTAHLMILQDPEFVGAIEEIIQEQQINAEAALAQIEQKFVKLLSGLAGNAYMQERVADVRDVSKRLLAHLLKQPLPDLQAITSPVILVATDLTPSMTAHVNPKFIKGFVTDEGGKTSHSAIMARTLGIPAVVGTGKATTDIRTGQQIIVNGTAGTVVLYPTTQQLKQAEAERAAWQQRLRDEEALRNSASQTADGHRVIVAANLGLPSDVEQAQKNGAEAVGLFRTEFLYMHADQFPSEDVQVEAYRQVLRAMPDKQVIIRTMDIGGDKRLPYWELPQEDNPFLGVRAIRLSLANEDVFRTQLRALLRASASGHLGIMFPLISNLSELRAAKKMLAEEKENLLQAGVKIGQDLQVGMMIEVPAAAILANRFAKEVDFFSIGSNDLVQYTLAADRTNRQLAQLSQPYNPAVLQLIWRTISAAHEAGIWCGMCGEAACDPIMLPLLIGAGLDEFSMNSGSILTVRDQLRHCSQSEAAELVAQVKAQAETASDVKKLVQAFQKREKA
ncbi:MAG: phosphoenolpyruvate--protein phosphotransferase [Lactobacillus sp.]|jgi:phosphotransferase system enzyme I (PtsI)|nr:phosphoenolpyruvate--protein phosphotransferase [Lactobacillus sp.]MCH3906621.1 phosphoenolpyruvate--protein phosphotransferase [Lactobacillus sp.]MCH3989743.1 phosphoenolpyruvate--protein phosphotransferase [Lactobacillus sp.]MCH4068091.1 phosphoenolpyruvate--protein phosphotransferase [Lactobacillus sp.]MCI1304272.1 phosphoenolpyruvate--protein phosphotransferase [Lactobacillus sp.]